VGDNADPDDDNDGFSDAREQQAVPQTDPLDKLSSPVTLPPAGITTLVVDAATTRAASERNGTATTPYRSISEALQVIREGQAVQVDTVQIRAGTYAELTTNERFPLDLSNLHQLTLQGTGRDTTILDAGFVDDVITAEGASHLTIDGVTLIHGVQGIEIFGSADITLRHSRSTGHNNNGIRFVRVSDLLLQDNEIDNSGEDGVQLSSGSTGRIIGNTLHDNEDDGMSLLTTAHAEVQGMSSKITQTMGSSCMSAARR
jgi:parallel beta-helix repeat protein